MYRYIILGAIIGFFLNFIIYFYSKDKLCIKNLFSINAIKNIYLTLAIIFLNTFLYTLIVKRLGFGMYPKICLALSSFLLVLSIVDLKIKLVPDSINLIIFILAIISIIINKQNILYHIIGFFIISLPFLAIAIFTNGIGGGDIKLFAVTGLFLGAIHIFLAMFICCFLASIFGIVLKVIYKNKPFVIPLVPFISFGVIFTILYGDVVLKWYFYIFF